MTNIPKSLDGLINLSRSSLLLKKISHLTLTVTVSLVTTKCLDGFWFMLKILESFYCHLYTNDFPRSEPFGPCFLRFFS